MTVSFEAADVLARREQDKYTRLWRCEQYRRASPGESCAPRALAALGARAGDSITDFGCGTGRAAVFFRGCGLAVHAVDHAANCLDPGVDIALEIACLWALPRAPATEYGFCVDVMEHIPPEQVTAVLDCIAARVRRAVFFRIGLLPDSCGRLIGEPLHLTIRPPAWWAEQLGRRFTVAQAGGDPSAIELVGTI